ncbi:MAG: SpoIID/LytB domain-containing protein [Bdellovibrionales bacterium]|nr:SpoIID/LytB domain-containing protein [Bdellovibrionales bacterium]
MKSWGLILLGACLPQLAGAALWAPVFAPFPWESQGFAPCLESVETVRVLVFPHWGKYSTPQKRESIADRVQISCGNQKLSFSIASPGLPRVLSCGTPMTVVREQGLKSFSYAGQLEVSVGVSEGGQKILQVINLVALEDYLKGVVPAEMMSSEPREALRAQAIAARTYGLFEILGMRQTNPDSPFDVDDTVFYQAYLGVSGVATSTSQAVDATRGMVMTYRGQVIKAYFSADSGGYTEDAVAVWGIELPYCRAKREVYDPKAIKSDWTRTLDLSTVTQKMIAAGLTTSNNRVVDIQIGSEDRTRSGRVGRAHVRFADNTWKILAGEDFRYILGLRSSLYSLTVQSDGSIPIAGKGFGHGVGMNQDGAGVLAKSMGWDAQTILHFYFDSIFIEKI